MLSKLFQIQLSSAYRSFLLRGNKKVKKTKPIVAVLIALLIVYVVGSLMFSVGTMFYLLAQGLLAVNLGWVYFANVGIMAFAMTVIFTIFMSQTLLFEAKDNEMLLALPIKPKDILLSRLLVLALVDFVSSLLFLLPAGAIYAYLVNPSAMFYILFLASTILLPLLGLAVSALFGYIISAITSKVNNKSLFVTSISIVLLALYMWGYTYIMTGMTKLIEIGIEMGAAIKKMLPPFYYFGKLLADGDMLALLWFVLWCLVPFSLILLWLSKTFIKLATVNRQPKAPKYQQKSLKSSSTFQALLRKELGKFLNSPMYLLNCGMSYILGLALGIYVLIKGAEVINLFSDIPNVASFTVPSIILMLCFLASMSFTTAPSISLEGKNLWILRSSPIDPRDIFKAKIALNLIFGFIALIFAGACIAFKLNPPFVETLLLFVIPLSVQVFTAQGGLIFNLLFPKFDAINDTVVVKQSASVIVTMLVSFALVAAITMGYIFLMRFNVSLALYGLIVAIFVNLLNVVGYRFIATKGVKIFNEF